MNHRSPHVRRAGSRVIALVFALLWTAGCSETIGPDSAGPSIQSVILEQNPLNVLALVATIRTTGAATVHAVVEGDSIDPISTPPTAVIDGEATIDIVGLLPSIHVTVRIVAVNAVGSRSQTAESSYEAPALPPDLPILSRPIGGSPGPGFVMFALTATVTPSKTYAVIVDNEGRIRWYRHFDSPVTDFQRRPDGSFTIFSSLGSVAQRFYSVDIGGRVLREYEASPPLVTDNHDLRFTQSGYYLLGIEQRSMDLTGIGGQVNALVRGLVLQRFDSDLLSFSWSTFDHMSVTDAASDINVAASSVNPWHANAIELDNDGTLLVSFRNADEISKIDPTSGNVVWRMGGKQNQFSFVNDPWNGFSHQHGIRRLPNGNMILFDNGNLHAPPTSRAVEYTVDEVAKTATMVWQYEGGPEYYSAALGFAERHPNGNTLICFGLAQKIVEVDQNGNVQWELHIDDPGHYAYRAFRISGFY